jgi:hypothetical protein
MFSKRPNPGGIINWRVGREDPQLTLEQLQSEIDAYDGAIAYIDNSVNALFAEFGRRGLDTRTLVIITSDHGESFGERGLLLHSHSVNWELIHVPLIFWMPGRVPGGMRIARPVTNAAIPATIAELVFENAGGLFPQRSLAALWGAQANQHDWPYPLSEMAHQPWAPKKHPIQTGFMKSLVSPHWHYMYHEVTGDELRLWPDHVKRARGAGHDTKSKAEIGEFHRIIDRLLRQVEETKTRHAAASTNISPQDTVKRPIFR